MTIATERSLAAGLDGYVRFETLKIASDERDWTVRVGFDRPISVGDRVTLVDSEDRVFAVATVATIIETTVDGFVGFNPSRYPKLRTSGQVVKHLQEYYPETDIDELELTETERKALDSGALTAEQVLQTRWWSAEMERCREAMAPLLTDVRRQPDMQLIKHGTTTESDGDHEVRMVFEVKGEDWELEEADA